MSTKMKLSAEQKQYLLKIKRTSKSVLIRDRAQAVLARNEDLIIADIAKALPRSDKFVRKAITLFKQGRLESTNLTSHNHKLRPGDRQEVIEMIRQQCPKELAGFKFTTQFWSIDLLRQVIKKKYSIEYKTDKTYHDLFKAAGFAFKKPKPRDFRQDPEKIKKFKGALKKSSKSTVVRLSW